MISLVARPTIASPSSPRSSLNKYCGNPVTVVTAEPGQYPMLEVAQAYVDLGLRPIPSATLNIDSHPLSTSMATSARTVPLCLPARVPGRLH